MDRYQLTFTCLRKERRIGFCPFAVLGDPNENQTLARIKKYIEAGADFLELGIPFSDPIADGKVIQEANQKALKNGMIPRKAIGLIKKIRGIILRQAQGDIPIGILTYSNIILRYGIDKFYRDLKNAGADSILIADVPLEEIKPFARAAKKHNLHQIFLVSEYTDLKRLRAIEKFASGFLYVVSTLGVTGVRKTLNPKTLTLVRSLKKKTKLPLMVGFGISKREHVKALQKAGADGAIVGSVLVKTPIAKIYRISAFTKSSRTDASS